VFVGGAACLFWLIIRQKYGVVLSGMWMDGCGWASGSEKGS